MGEDKTGTSRVIDMGTTDLEPEPVTEIRPCPEFMVAGDERDGQPSGPEALKGIAGRRHGGWRERSHPTPGMKDITQQDQPICLETAEERHEGPLPE